MASTLAVFLALLAFGYGASRTGRYGAAAADALNRFVIDLCLPALVLRIVPGLELRWELMLLVVVPWVVVAVAVVTVGLANRALRFDGGTRAALLLCVGLGNTAFLGFPLTAAVLGDASLPMAVVYDQFGSFLALSTFGLVVVARAAGGARPTVGVMLRKVVTFPPFVALILALLPIPHPAWLDEALGRIGAALVPAATFAVGLRMKLAPPRPLRAFVLGLALRLLVVPLCAWGLAVAAGASIELTRVAVVQSAMPAMITAAALAASAGLAPELAANLAGWGIVWSLATVPMWAALVG